MKNIDPIRITNWTVSYDEHGMPGQLTGDLDTAYSTFKKGHSVVIRQPKLLDLKDNIAKDNSGRTFMLLGPGVQSILTEHVEPFGYIRILDAESDPFEEE